MAKAKYIEWLEPDNLLKLESYARDGLTDEDISHNMGINVGTLYKWKNEHSEISNALKKGKEVVDILVENALFKRAVGYTFDEVTQERNIVTGELIITKIVKKEVQPDTTAQIFWLKNRKPKEWRDVQDLKHSGEINNPTHEALLQELRNRKIEGFNDGDDVTSMDE